MVRQEKNINCEYDMQYNWQDYNRKIVNKVFDNYEDSKRYTDELNKKCYQKKYLQWEY